MLWLFGGFGTPPTLKLVEVASIYCCFYRSSKAATLSPVVLAQKEDPVSIAVASSLYFFSLKAGLSKLVGWLPTATLRLVLEEEPFYFLPSRIFI